MNVVSSVCSLADSGAAKSLPPWRNAEAVSIGVGAIYSAMPAGIRRDQSLPLCGHSIPISIPVVEFLCGMTSSGVHSGRLLARW
jgi:hypothetical protein